MADPKGSGTVSEQPRRASGGKRGRKASQPSDIPRKGWKDILLRVKDEQSRDNLSIVSAGVAFYWFLAIFPALAAMVSIYGLVADPQQLQRQIDGLGGVMPQQAYQILRDQLMAVVQHSGGALSLGMIAGILLTLWSANKGMKALMTALSIVYDEEENRGFIRQNAISLMSTLIESALQRFTTCRKQIFEEVAYERGKRKWFDFIDVVRPGQRPDSSYSSGNAPGQNGNI